MKKITFSCHDFGMFDGEFNGHDYEFFFKHTGAFKRFLKEESKEQKQQFLDAFCEFFLNHGEMKAVSSVLDGEGNVIAKEEQRFVYMVPYLRNMSSASSDKGMKEFLCASPKDNKKRFVDSFKLYGIDNFVNGKLSAARQFLNDTVMVAKNKHMIQFMDSQSYTKDPFFNKDTRDVFRRLFGEPSESGTCIKVICLLPIYIKFAGSICRYLRRWLEADEIPTTLAALKLSSKPQRSKKKDDGEKKLKLKEEEKLKEGEKKSKGEEKRTKMEGKKPKEEEEKPKDEKPSIMVFKVDRDGVQEIRRTPSGDHKFTAVNDPAYLEAAGFPWPQLASTYHDDFVGNWSRHEEQEMRRRSSRERMFNEHNPMMHNAHMRHLQEEKLEKASRKDPDMSGSKMIIGNSKDTNMKGKTSEDNASKGKISKEITIDRKSSEGKTSEDNASEGKTSEDNASKGKISKEKIIDSKSSEGKTSEDNTSKGIISKEKIIDSKSSEEKTSEDNTSKGIISKEKIIDSKSSEEKTSEDNTSKMKISKEKMIDSKSSEEKTSEDNTSKMKISKEKMIDSKSSEEKTSEDNMSNGVISKEKMIDSKSAEGETSVGEISEENNPEGKPDEEIMVEMETSEGKPLEGKTSQGEVSEQMISDLEERKTTEKQLSNSDTFEGKTIEEQSILERKISEMKIPEDNSSENKLSDGVSVEECDDDNDRLIKETFPELHLGVPHPNEVYDNMVQEENRRRGKLKNSSENDKLHTCAFCKITEIEPKTFKKCQKCKGKGTKFYCCRSCQRNDWPKHQFQHKN